MNFAAGFQDLKAIWNQGLKDEVFRSFVSFLILTFLAFMACTLFPELMAFATDLIASVVAGAETVEGANFSSLLVVMASNIDVAVFSMLYGMIPFIFLPALPLGVNAAALGVLLASALQKGTLALFLAGFLPHNIFKIPALLIGFAMGLFVCGQLTRRCKKDTTAFSPMQCLVLISRMLFVLLLPVLFVSALVEVWVTPAVLLLFQ